MVDRVFHIFSKSGFSTNHIPSGRQLNRTPPTMGVVKQLNFEVETPNVPGPVEEQSQNETAAWVSCSGSTGEDKLPLDSRCVAFQTPEASRRTRIGSVILNDEPDSLLRGMEGITLTQADLDFIQRLKLEKELKKLQEELMEKKKRLQREIIMKDQSLALRTMKFACSEEMLRAATVFLREAQQVPRFRDQPPMSPPPERGREGLAHLKTTEPESQESKEGLKEGEQRGEKRQPEQQLLDSKEVTSVCRHPKSVLAQKDVVQEAILRQKEELAQLQTLLAEAHQNKNTEEHEKETLKHRQGLLERMVNVMGMRTELSSLQSELAKTNEIFQHLKGQICALKDAQTVVKEKSISTADKSKFTTSKATLRQQRGRNRNPEAKTSDKMNPADGKETTSSLRSNEESSQIVNTGTSYNLRQRRRALLVPGKEKCEEPTSKATGLKSRGRKPSPETTSSDQKKQNVNKPARSRKLATGLDQTQVVLRQSKRAVNK